MPSRGNLVEEDDPEGVAFESRFWNESVPDDAVPTAFWVELLALIVDFVSATWEQPGHTKTCTMVVASTSIERDHFFDGAVRTVRRS